jgi:hypothetical protein
MNINGLKSYLIITLNTLIRPSRAMELTAYDVKAKKKVKIENPKVVKMKNGRWAVSGKSALTGNKVYRILSKEEKAAMK